VPITAYPLSATIFHSGFGLLSPFLDLPQDPPQRTASRHLLFPGRPLALGSTEFLQRLFTIPLKPYPGVRTSPLPRTLSLSFPYLRKQRFEIRITQLVLSTSLIRHLPSKPLYVQSLIKILHRLKDNSAFTSQTLSYKSVLPQHVLA
jgi:hypothetical protein